MSAPKLPPGPWRWDGGRLVDAEGCLVVSADWEQRGFLPEIRPYVETEGGETDGSDAVARAIAAVPELVAVARAVMDEKGRERFLAREALEKAGLL